MVSVQSLADGSMFRLGADSRCVPFMPLGEDLDTRILSVEPGFEDLRCVSYSTSNATGGFVASEAFLGSRVTGEIVVVRAVPGSQRVGWLLVKIIRLVS
jgi:hypothetical protein